MDIDIPETTEPIIDNHYISPNLHSFSSLNTFSFSPPTDQDSSLLLGPPSPLLGPPSPLGSQSPLPGLPPQVAETEFLQIVSIKMKHGSFSIHELFHAFPMAVRIWSGVSSIGGAAARLGFKTASIAAEALKKHGEYAESTQLGEYRLYAELEDEEDEWWKTNGTQTWQSIRCFW